MSQYGQIDLNINLLNSGNANLWTPIYYLETAPNSLIGHKPYQLFLYSGIGWKQNHPTSLGKLVLDSPKRQTMGCPCSKTDPDVEKAPAQQRHNTSTSPLLSTFSKKHDDEDIASLPEAIQVNRLPLPIYANPSVNSEKLNSTRGTYRAQLGSFWQPIAKAKIKVPGTGRFVTAWEIELSSSNQRGWLIDYHEEQTSSVVVPVTRTAFKEMHKSEKWNLICTVNEKQDAARREHQQAGKYQVRNPRTGKDGRVELPSQVQVLKHDSKLLALREGPEYPGDKLEVASGFMNVMKSTLNATPGQEFTPLGHQEFVWRGDWQNGAQNRVINFYKVEALINGQKRQGWLLDYTPNADSLVDGGMDMLAIKYIH